MKKPIYATVPIDLVKWVIKHGNINYFRLYIYLKYNSNGRISYTNEQIDYWAMDLGKSNKWVRNAVKWLEKKKWISVNSIKGLIHIKSYHRLMIKLKLTSKRAFRYDTDYFYDFEAYCYAAVICQIINSKKYSDKHKRSAYNMRYAKSNRFYPRGFYPVSLAYIAASLGVSIATARRYKKKAQMACLITVKRQIVPVEDWQGNYVSVERYNEIKALDPETAKRLRKGEKYLKIVEADIIKPEILLKKKHLKIYK